MNKTIRQLYQEHKGNVSDTWSLYLDERDRLFTPYRDQQIQLLEIGVQNGGSLEIWSAYFSKARKIIGCDVNEKCSQLQYRDSRNVVIVGDVNSEACENKILAQASVFDIVIDDGSHQSSDVIHSFARYFRHLNYGGVYIVEDLHSSYWKNFEGGLHQPLSSMAFFKRLADVINYEHWRNNKSAASLLSTFSTELDINFDKLDLEEIHSIEFVNSLCVIRKLSSDKNVLGKRIIAGTVEQVTSEWEQLNGTTVQDIEATIIDDANLDVFELMTCVHSLTQTIADREQSLQELTSRIGEREQELAEIKNSEIWKLAKLLGRIRVLLVPLNSRRDRILRRLINVFMPDWS